MMTINKKMGENLLIKIKNCRIFQSTKIIIPFHRLMKNKNKYKYKKTGKKKKIKTNLNKNNH